MNPIKIRVFCDLHKREMDTYCYVREDNQNLYIRPNGCEECNGSSFCRSCFDKCASIAKEKLIADNDTNLFLK